MRRDLEFQLRKRPVSRLLMLVTVLGLSLSVYLISGLDLPTAQAQDPDRHYRIWLPIIQKGNGQNPLGQLGPYEAPSSFGEMYLLRQAGMLPGPEPGPVSPSQVPKAAERQPSLTQPGVDILVNNPVVDTPENTTQSETTLAVLGNTICAGYNDSGAGGLSGLSRSVNLGSAWTDLGGIGQSGDPVLAVHEATGNFYYAEIATIGGNPSIGVARSTDDCWTFGAAVDASPVSSGFANTTLNDKPWIAVDNTGGARDGNIYACWTRFFDTDGDGMADTSELRFSRSLDGGLTYQNEQILQAAGTAPFGCSVAVGPNGEVNVAWADRAGATQNDIRFRRSVDGGVNFAATAQVSTGNRHPGIDNVVACGTLNRPSLNGNIRMLHQAWMAVDTTGGPFDGNIYVVWASDPVNGTDQSDVFFSRSTNGGVNWSAAVQLGAGGGATDQFEPFVAVGGAGAVSIAWYDRRNDVANNNLIDVYKAFSRDGGANFDPIIRVTDVNFPVPPLNPNFDPAIAPCYMGEYIAIASDAHNFYYAWGDNQNTLVTANYPGGRPDPDVFFDFQEAPVVNEADLRISKSDAPDPVVAGEQLSYTVSVFNDGPDIALDVIVIDVLPLGVNYVSDTTGGCDTSALPTLICSLGDMVSGDMRQFTILVDVDSDLVANAGGPTAITNAASVTAVAMDMDPSDTSVSEDTLVIAAADLEIVSFEAVNPPAEILVGAPVEITLRKIVTNNGPSAPMDVELTKTASAPPDSIVTPNLSVSSEPALGLNELREVDEVFTIECGAASHHTFAFSNEIQPLNPEDTDPDQSNNFASLEVGFECVVPVAINIKPGSDPNSINPRNEGVIPVAILTTLAGEYGTPLDFDATTIDPLSVRFGPPEAVTAETGGAFETHGRGHIEDSKELDESTMDGDLDMVLHFKTQETTIEAGDTEACAKGEWVDAAGNVHKFFGCDAIRTVGN
jgi:uncharacterized repeat protein (TIGR01451 family)